MVKFRGCYLPRFMGWILISICSISSSKDAQIIIEELQNELVKKDKKRKKGGR